MCSIFQGKLPDQYARAEKFTDKVREKYGDKVTYVQSGHSAGAGYAELLSIRDNTKAVVFESPGVYKIATGLFSDRQINKHKITSYATVLNMINTSSKHISTPIQIASNDIDYGAWYISYTMRSHKIKDIPGLFDDKTGVPKETYKVDAWPLGLRAGWAVYNKYHPGDAPPPPPNHFEDLDLFGDHLYTFKAEKKAETTSSSQSNEGQKTSTSNPNNNANPDWHQYSNYGSKIETTNGEYDFLSAFNQGNYNSPFDLSKNVQLHEAWGGRASIYSKSYVDKMNELRNIEIRIWQMKTEFENKHKPSGSGQSERKVNFEYRYSYFRNNEKFKNDYKYFFKRNTADSFDQGHNQGSGSSGGFQAGPANVGGSGYYRGKKDWGFKVNFKFGFPTIIDLKNDGIKLSSLEKSTAFYDIDGNGYLQNLAWPDREDAFLAMDQDLDGKISLHSEISFKYWHSSAKTDLDGLKLYFDTNKDGKLNSQDQYFYNFKVWQDHNQNGISEEGEVKDLSDYGITEIALNENIPMKSSFEINGNKVF